MQTRDDFTLFIVVCLAGAAGAGTGYFLFS